MTPDFATRLETLAGRIEADPDFRRYQDRGQVGHPYEALKPRDVRGYALGIARLLTGVPRTRGGRRAVIPPIHLWKPVDNKDFGDEDEKTRLWLAANLARSIPFLWYEEIFRTAKDMPLPRHVVGADVLPHDRMFWVIQKATARMKYADDAPWVDVEAHWWLLMRDNKLGRYYVATGGSGRRPGEDDFAHCAAITRTDFGARYPDNVGGDMGTLLGLAAFLNSPFVNVQRHTHSTRASRRRYGPRIGDPEAVHVITLRAEVREAVRVERGEGPRWKQRWLVRGHYRAQWYASTQSHKVIWIAPYIKGPEDAPLKLPTYQVAR